MSARLAAPWTPTLFSHYSTGFDITYLFWKLGSHKGVPVSQLPEANRGTDHFTFKELVCSSREKELVWILSIHSMMVRSALAVLRNIDRKVFVKMLSSPGRITWLSPLASYWRLHLSWHRRSSSMPVASIIESVISKTFHLLLSDSSINVNIAAGENRNRSEHSLISSRCLSSCTPEICQNLGRLTEATARSVTFPFHA